MGGQSQPQREAFFTKAGSYYFGKETIMRGFITHCRRQRCIFRWKLVAMREESGIVWCTVRNIKNPRGAEVWSGLHTTGPFCWRTLGDSIALPAGDLRDSRTSHFSGP